LNQKWRKSLIDLKWPTSNLPEIIVQVEEPSSFKKGQNATLRAFIREYIFVSIFRACAESLASENASRLAAMQRADKNIEDLLVSLNGTFHRSRQSEIDDELFDVVAGFETLNI
jgi:F-type H+-transporting ATPase subunit gamma